MKARRCRSALVALLALVFVLLPGVAAIAADKAAPKAAAGNIADRWVLWPKPGEAKAFEAGVREHAAWRKKAGEPFTWVMYQPIAGSDLTYYVIRSDNHAWKDFDAEEAWSTKAKAEEAYQQQLGMHGRGIEPITFAVRQHHGTVESSAQKYPSGRHQRGAVPLPTGREISGRRECMRSADNGKEDLGRKHLEIAAEHEWIAEIRKALDEAEQEGIREAGANQRQ